jgi:UDP-N-acetylmuramoylalanine--D-glutamate ligase
MNLAGRAVLVAGAGVSGTAAAAVLADLGARVRIADDTAADAWRGDAVPPGVDLVVTSPGWRPDAPLLADATRRGIAVWGEVELAWRLRPAGQRWLAVTGTNGKTTTTAMLAAVLSAAGVRSAAVGNIGDPAVLAVRRTPAYDVLAVELSSFQLHWSSSLAPAAAALLNLADDHLDWHGSRAAYAAAKGKIFASPDTVALANAADPPSLALLATAAGRKVTFGGDGALRVADGWLVDGAFGGGALLPVERLGAPGEHNVVNALAAAGLARAAGVAPSAIAAGLSGFRLGDHRLALVGRHRGVAFVNDSKATNPAAAIAALRSFDSIVWIAGGLNKGLDFDELATVVAGSGVRAAVLLGSCAAELAQSLALHAARLPVIRVSSMEDAVREASRLARPGDTVVLAPAAASMDMFRDYADRGRAFAAAVAALVADEGEGAT